MSLLRPQQREELKSERDTLQRKLHNPYIQDKGAVNAQLNRIDRQLETQTPKPYKGEELDNAVKREADLREKLLNGMPSQEEMRKAPPGAVGKHMAWEKRNKKDLLEWKEIKLRLEPNSDDPDIANFERYRPTRSSLNMDNAQIQGKQYFLPTEAYKQGYDQITWTNLDETTPETAAKDTESKGSYWTPERRAAQAEKMKKLRAEGKLGKKKEA